MMKDFTLTVLVFFSCLTTTASATNFYYKCTPEDTNEITQLACNIYFESRGESHTGQLAVAFNTLNRVDSYKYPNTVREVVWQRKQYSWTHDGKSDVIKDYNTFVKALQIASYVYELDQDQFKVLSPIENALWYHNINILPKWVDKRCEVAKIGLHVYYDCVKLI